MRRVLVALMLVYLTACASNTTKTTLVTDDPTATGREIYAADCAWCHGDDGSGSGRGPSLVSKGAAGIDFVLTTGRMPIDEPDDDMRRHDPLYDEEQIAEIVEYAEQLVGEPAVPEVDLTAADYALGSELYTENCASCHSSAGSGGILTDDQEIPPVLRSSSIQVVEAMLTGPGEMPVFGEETFDKREMDSIALYIQALQDGDNRGGADLGRLGPVAEGAVGLLLGLGLMVALVRWIGTRADE